jgi:hypothetical protein
LACWHVGQLRTNWSTCFLRPGQAKNCYNLLMVARIPKCPTKGELWNALISCYCQPRYVARTGWGHLAVRTAMEQLLELLLASLTMLEPEYPFCNLGWSWHTIVVWRQK